MTVFPVLCSIIARITNRAMIRGRRKYSGKQKSPSASHRAGGKATKDRVQLSCSNYTTLRVNPQIHAENTLNQLAGNLPQSIKELLYRMYLRMIHLRICVLCPQMNYPVFPNSCRDKKKPALCASGRADEESSMVRFTVRGAPDS